MLGLKMATEYTPQQEEVDALKARLTADEQALASDDTIHRFLRADKGDHDAVCCCPARQKCMPYTCLSPACMACSEQLHHWKAWPQTSTSRHNNKPIIPTSTISATTRPDRGGAVQALKRLTGHLAWRREVKPERLQCSSCLRDPTSHFFHPVGYAKNRCPVMYSCNGLASDKSRDGNREHMIMVFEQTIRSMPPGVEKWVWVSDLRSFGFRDMGPVRSFAYLSSMLCLPAVRPTQGDSRPGAQLCLPFPSVYFACLLSDRHSEIWARCAIPRSSIDSQAGTAASGRARPFLFRDSQPSVSRAAAINSLNSPAVMLTGSARHAGCGQGVHRSRKQALL